jgi:hypothetical protein
MFANFGNSRWKSWGGRNDRFGGLSKATCHFACKFRKIIFFLGVQAMQPLSSIGIRGAPSTFHCFNIIVEHRSTDQPVFELDCNRMAMIVKQWIASKFHEARLLKDGPLETFLLVGLTLNSARACAQLSMKGRFARLESLSMKDETTTTKGVPP